MEYGEDTRDRVRSEIQRLQDLINHCTDKIADLFSEIDDYVARRESYEREQSELELHLDMMNEQFG